MNSYKFFLKDKHVICFYLCFCQMVSERCKRVGEKRLKEGHTGWGHLRNNVFSVDSILHSKYFIAIHYFRDVARPRHYGGRLTLQNLP
jgi:hypothetical protein